MNDVADEETEDTFIIVHLEGAGVDDIGSKVTGKGGMGSWNCSRTDGIYGPPCTVPRPFGQDMTCYASCSGTYSAALISIYIFELLATIVSISSINNLTKIHLYFSL